ncbi:unnamed protein product [Sphacelaria rigidula]
MESCHAKRTTKHIGPQRGRYYSSSLVTPNNNIIGTRWVYKVKADERFKARLVLRGWTQKHGFDCRSAFAPVCRLESQRILLAIATARNWPIIIALDMRPHF